MAKITCISALGIFFATVPAASTVGFPNPLVRFMERRLKMVRRHSSMLIIITAIALVVAGGYFAVLK